MTAAQLDNVDALVGHLLADDGAAVAIEAAAVTVNAEWTGWRPARFEGETLEGALVRAAATRRRHSLTIRNILDILEARPAGGGVTTAIAEWKHGDRVRLSEAGRELVSPGLRDRLGTVWTVWRHGGPGGPVLGVMWDGRKRADLLGQRLLERTEVGS